MTAAPSSAMVIGLTAPVTAVMLEVTPSRFLVSSPSPALVARAKASAPATPLVPTILTRTATKTTPHIGASVTRPVVPHSRATISTRHKPSTATKATLHLAGVGWLGSELKIGVFILDTISHIVGEQHQALVSQIMYCELDWQGGIIISHVYEKTCYILFIILQFLKNEV